MGQVLHGSAKTTHAVRAELQRLRASVAQIAKRFGINEKTVSKWRNRQSVDDMPMGPEERRSTVLSPMSHASSPGRCWAPMSWMRWGGPSATLTRTAANLAASLPLVPLRQLTFCHFALSSMAFAVTDWVSGTWRWRGRPRPATGNIMATSTE